MQSYYYNLVSMILFTAMLTIIIEYEPDLHIICFHFLK